MGLGNEGPQRSPDSNGYLSTDEHGPKEIKTPNKTKRRNKRKSQAEAAVSAQGGRNCSSSQSPQEQLALPTDAKEREKEKKKQLKEKGTPHVPKKQFKPVEEHYDDCGEDLSSLHGIEHKPSSASERIFSSSLPMD